MQTVIAQPHTATDFFPSTHLPVAATTQARNALYRAGQAAGSKGEQVMNALEAANDLLGTAIIEHSNGDGIRGDRLTEQALAFAAIAQAEQLKRIADALEAQVEKHIDPRERGTWAVVDGLLQRID